MTTGPISMDGVAASTVTRYRPAVIACAGLAAAGSVFIIYRNLFPSQDTHVSGKLRRSNAIRIPDRNSSRDPRHARHDAQSPTSDPLADARPNPRRRIDQGTDASTVSPSSARRQSNAADLALDEDLDETEAGLDDVTAAAVEMPEARRLKELAYAIAKSEHDKKGLVHHGVTCDKCQAVPIKGIRYHCANCPDFDLCEDCEATDTHLKTHIFYKVRIPAPWGGKEPLPLWYPGKPHELPPSLDEYLPWKKEISDASGFPMNKVDGLYQQFSCMANAKLRDSNDTAFRLGIDRAAFNYCFAQQIMSSDRKAVPSLISDRLFAMFDTDGDEIIDFGEFVMGTSLIHKKIPSLRRRRVFTSLDVDDDGSLSRRDCLRMLRAYYDLNKEVLLGFLKVDRVAENADFVEHNNDFSSHITGGRSLASYFTESLPQWEERPQHDMRHGKVTDEYGDWRPADWRAGTVRDDYHFDDFYSQQVIASGSWRDLKATLENDFRRVLRGMFPEYLPVEHVRAFEISPQNARRTHKIHEDAGSFWVISQTTMGGKAIYLRVREDVLEAEDPNWRQRRSESRFARMIFAQVETDIYEDVLPNAIEERGKSKLQWLRKYRRFNEDSDDHLPYIQGEFVGGSAAAHTIYNVASDALNEMLDPIFCGAERLALCVESTTEERIRRADEVEAYIKDLHDRVWGLVEQTFRIRLDMPETVKGGVSDANHQLRQVKARLRQGHNVLDPDEIGSAVDSYLTVRASEMSRIDNSNSDQDFFPESIGKSGGDLESSFIRWVLLLSAEIYAEQEDEIESDHEEDTASATTEEESVEGSLESRSIPYDDGNATIFSVTEFESFTGPSTSAQADPSFEADRMLPQYLPDAQSIPPPTSSPTSMSPSPAFITSPTLRASPSLTTPSPESPPSQPHPTQDSGVIPSTISLSHSKDSPTEASSLPTTTPMTFQTPEAPVNQNDPRQTKAIENGEIPEAHEEIESAEKEDEELFRLAALEIASREIKDLGGPGLVGFHEFERLLCATEVEDQLLGWIEAWLDVVTF